MQSTTSLLVPYDWTDLVLRAHGEASAHLRPPATWQEVSLIIAVDRRRQLTDRSPDDVSQLRESKTTTKRRLWITEAFVCKRPFCLHVETLLLRTRCVRAPSRASCAFVDRRSREQSIGSPFDFGHLRRASSLSQQVPLAQLCF